MAVIKEEEKSFGRKCDVVRLAFYEAVEGRMVEKAWLSRIVFSRQFTEAGQEKREGGVLGPRK